MNNNFLAVYGTAITRTPWLQPNLIRLGQWWSDMLLHPQIDDYEFYVVGNFAEKIFGISQIPTWDVDVVVIGDIANTKQFKYLLNDAVQLGFNHQLFVDIAWMNDLWDITEWRGNVTKIRPGITMYKKMHGRETTQTFQYDSEITLDEDLVMGVYENPPASWQKAHQRYLDGHYLGVFENLKKMFN